MLDASLRAPFYIRGGTKAILLRTCVIKNIYISSNITPDGSVRDRMTCLRARTAQVAASSYAVRHAHFVFISRQVRGKLQWASFVFFLLHWSRNLESERIIKPSNRVSVMAMVRCVRFPGANPLSWRVSYRGRVWCVRLGNLENMKYGQGSSDNECIAAQHTSTKCWWCATTTTTTLLFLPSSSMVASQDCVSRTIDKEASIIINSSRRAGNTHRLFRCVCVSEKSFFLHRYTLLVVRHIMTATATRKNCPPNPIPDI